jgi:lipopolysaccharide export system protein LptA
MTAAAFIRHAALAAALAAIGTVAATAQPAVNGPPNALQGFSQNRGQPVKIEASRLEVRDKDKKATFSGKVKVVQGDTTMRCATLVVFYEPKQPGAPTKAAMPAATPGPGGSQQISKLEALGGVTVTQKDQTATGDNGLFDMKSNTVTLTGNVLVSQGPNVLRGNKLVVDLTTGVSHVESGNGPVQMLINQDGSTAGPKFGPQRSEASKSPK